MSVERVFEKKLSGFGYERVKQATPGFCLQVFYRGKKTVDLRFGKTYKYYDVASLTKPIFSLSSVYSYLSKKPEVLYRDVFESLKGEKKGPSLKKVLTHQTGLAPWKGLYLGLKKVPKKRDSKNLRKALKAELVGENFRKGEIESRYSDLGYLLLGFWLESVWGESLEKQWVRVQKRMGLSQTHFNPHLKLLKKKEDYAPTQSVKWGPKKRQGIVHDNNTLVLGGVSTHAGLFAPIEDVVRWGLILRSVALEKRNPWFQNPFLRKALFHRQMIRELGDWSCGLMKPTRGKASCGRYFSTSSVGHLGYTGTSLWYDMRKDLLMVLLANRNYPETKGQQGFSKLRPVLHDWAMESHGYS